MPINPRQGETEQEYISRCIATEIDAGYDEEQAAAICYNTWENKMSKQSTEQRIANKLAKIEQKRKDIEQQELEGACWPNYIQIGTKIKDGREVPDCRGPVD